MSANWTDRVEEAMDLAEKFEVAGLSLPEYRRFRRLANLLSVTEDDLLGATQ